MSRSATAPIPEGWFPLTYDDYLVLPNDGRRYQILEGELDVNPAPTTRHQKISMRLEHQLVSHVEAQCLGLVLYAPVDVMLDERNVVQPDIVFVSTERMPIVEEAKIAGAPDLVVEILSPASARTDRGPKASIYARHGVAWYWLVDPAEDLVEEYELVGRGYTLRGRLGRESVFRPALFPGLEIALEPLFRP
jgi:Uma2 family endonuclease